MMMRLLAIILKSATRITVAPHERNFRDETHPCPLLFWGAGGEGVVTGWGMQKVVICVITAAVVAE